MTTFNDITSITRARAEAFLGRRLSLVGRLNGQQDPYPLYERMRARGPLHRERIGVWVSTSHRVVDQVLRDRRFGVRQSDGALPDVRRASSEANSLIAESFISQDPPNHGRLRKLAAPAFSPRKIDGYRERIEKVADSLLDKEDFDLITDFAAPLPIAVISDLLGIPDEDTARFAEYGRLIGAAEDGVTTLDQVRSLRQANQDLTAIFDRLIGQRRARPGDDVISALVAAEAEEKLTATELVATCGLLLLAGFETTVNLIGNGALALLEHPEQWAMLKEDPDLAPRVVEETLRYAPPVHLTARLAHSDIEIADQVVRKDKVVVLVIGAANRDPDTYPDPNRFDLTRDQRPEHLAFSSGIHYCLGATLARIEGDVAFRALAALPTLRQAGPLRHRESAVIRGLSSFPVTRS